MLVVQKAQQAVLIAEENIRKNNEEIEATKRNMRQADPMMYDAYDKFLIHLWEKAEQLELIRQEKQAILDEEKRKLVKLEQAVKVLEKHKEKSREAYIEEEKKAELKQYSELGVTRFFAQSRERQAEEEKEILRQLEELEGT
ncbi:hypothetical protein IKP85_02795 [bacterium]|nr:hypothetical protein [bacterium]